MMAERSLGGRLALASALALAGESAPAATVVVTSAADNIADDGVCTLREALALINAGGDAATNGCSNGGAVYGSDDLIDFAAELVDSTISFGADLGALSVSKSVTIHGGHQTLDAHGASGVLYVGAGATLALSRMHLANGNAARGAGLYVNGATAVLNDVTVSGNAASNRGGGLYAKTGTLTLSNCTFAGNSGFWGGGLALSAANVTVIDTTLSGNAAGVGGAVYASASTLHLINSTVSGNSAAPMPEVGGSGGGIVTKSGNLVLTGSTLSGNAAMNDGGGIVVQYGYLALGDTIVSGNQAALQGDLERSYTLTMINSAYSLLGTGVNAAFLNDNVHNVFSDSPGLLPLADNGGPTQTMALAQNPNSPAINAGNPNVLQNYDQRGPGFPRRLGAQCDIGAYQHQGDRVFADGLEPAP